MIGWIKPIIGFHLTACQITVFNLRDAEPNHVSQCAKQLSYSEFDDKRLDLYSRESMNKLITFGH